MGLQFSITAIGSIMLQSANNALGTACVAAFTAAMRIKMFFMCPLESLGIAMATYTGQNYGAGKARTHLDGSKGKCVNDDYLLGIYVLRIDTGGTYVCLAFVEASELEILKDTGCCTYFRVLLPGFGIALYSAIYHPGSGIYQSCYAFRSFEMIARVLVSLYAVPAFGYLAVCFGDPTAWIAAVLFLVPAFIFVYRRLLRMRRRTVSIIPVLLPVPVLFAGSIHRLLPVLLLSLGMGWYDNQPYLHLCR